MTEEKRGSWCDIFKTFKYSISPQKLLVALIGLIVFNLLSIAFFQENTILISARDHLGNAFGLAAGQQGGINFIESAKELAQVPLSFLPGPKADATLSEVQWHYPRLVLFYLCVWIVFAAIVGVITRISAVQVARDENVGFKEGFKFAMRKYPSYFAPPVLVIVAFLIVGVLLNFTIGLLNLIPMAGPVIFAVVFPLSLILGLTAVIVIVFGTLGSPLMGPAIGVEGQDTFDALSRAYHYSIQRFGRYVLYMVVLFFFMAVSCWFVKTFIVQGIDTVTRESFALAGLGTDLRDQSPKDDVVESAADVNSEKAEVGRYERMVQAYRYTWPMRANYIVERNGSLMLVGEKEEGDVVERVIELDGGEEVGGFILGVWLKGLYYLVGAFAVSFFFTGSTIIYYILRKQIDGAELDEVYMEGEEEEFEFGEEPQEETENEETEESK